MIENGRHTENGSYIETDIIETTDEDGQVHVFEKVSELEVDGQEYALLIYKGNQPEELDEEAEETEEGYEEEVVVMRISYEDGQEVYEAIEDEAEFEKVVAFIDNMDDEEGDVEIDVTDFTENNDN
jgi:anti-sigma factor ChrR (cupin superfamily)